MVDFETYTRRSPFLRVARFIRRELDERYGHFLFRHYLTAYGKFCFLAMDGEDVVGAVLCVVAEREGYIPMLVVRGCFQRRKIGSTLLFMALNRMHRSGVVCVTLEVMATNRAAVGMYQKSGFFPVEYLPDHYGANEDGYKMQILF
ncbi:MAG: N-acetyltransferase MAK3-like [Amphiamblys sp. WSBS2006]|nr:MAG: N-acetyltransferase MAK3-like [Amphiamblys sp. WSBS2006]